MLEAITTFMNAYGWNLLATIFFSLLMLTIMARDSSMSSFGFNGFSIRSNKNR